jgi:hypothetical protein
MSIREIINSRRTVPLSLIFKSLFVYQKKRGRQVAFLIVATVLAFIGLEMTLVVARKQGEMSMHCNKPLLTCLYVGRDAKKG